MSDAASRKKIKWTAEQDQMIIRLRSEQVQWNDIAERVGRTIESCCARYRALVPAGARARFKTSKRWSPEDEAELKRLIGERKRVPEISRIMSRSPVSIQNKIEYIRRQGRPMHFVPVSRVDVPPACEVDRERRYAAERDLTAMFFGDPRPGQSALDKKQGAFA